MLSLRNCFKNLLRLSFEDVLCHTGPLLWFRVCLGTRRRLSRVGCLARLRQAPPLALGRAPGSSAKPTLDLETSPHRYQPGMIWNGKNLAGPNRSVSVTGDNYFSIRTETSVQYSVLGKVMLCNKSGQVPMKQCFFSSLVMVSLLETTHMALLQLDCQIQQKEFHVIHLYVKDIILKAQFGF